MQAIKDSWIDKHLIAYFPYNNNPDDVVQGITPTSLAVDYDAGYNGQSAKFDGTNNKYINYPSAPFTFTDGNDKPFTIFGWYYFDGINNYFFVNKRDGNGINTEYEVIIYQNKLYLWLLGNNDNRHNLYKYAENRVQANQWVHIIATYNGNKDVTGIGLYINGISYNDGDENTGYSGMAKSNSLMIVGNPQWAASLNLKGKIDGLGFLDTFVDDNMAMELYQKHLVDEIRN